MRERRRPQPAAACATTCAGRRRCRRSVDLPLRRHVINGLISVEAAAAAAAAHHITSRGASEELAQRSTSCSMSQVREDLAVVD